ncbi:MAG: hypothetical protein FJW30_10990 [Acidobacteria bacterium]|nr:hypothetical protein [Acidobacteriota bacterium]
MVQAVLRLFSYVFQLLISLGALAAGTVAALSDNTTFQFDFLPWSGAELRNWLIGLGLLGLVSVVLAYRGTMKYLFVAWTLVATGLVVRGIFLSGYTFDGESDFKWALFFLSGVAATVLGALSRARMR